MYKRQGFDTFAFLNAVVAAPAAYGFTDVDSACFQGSIILGGVACQNPSQYLFWDDSHPTARGHHLLGLAFADVLQEDVVPEPLTLVLGVLGVGAALARRRRAA